MSEVIGSIFPSPSIDIPTPVVQKATPPPDESSAAVKKAEDDFMARQALLSKKSTTATNPLGVASDILQTSRKSLLGG